MKFHTDISSLSFRLKLFLFSVSIKSKSKQNPKTIFLSGSVNDILDELNGEEEMRDSRSFQDQDDNDWCSQAMIFNGTVMMISLTSAMRASPMNIPANQSIGQPKPRYRRPTLPLFGRLLIICFSLVVWLVETSYGHYTWILTANIL